MKKSIRGIVQKHLGRGRKLGYPTANIDVRGAMEEGIFLGYTTIYNSPLNSPHPPSLIKEGVRGSSKSSGQLLPSIIFIGAPEMFGESDKRLEAYILDFEGDLYGQEIEVKIVKKLRENRKFNTEAALIEQMKIDEKQAREFFQKVSLPLTRDVTSELRGEGERPARQ